MYLGSIYCMWVLPCDLVGFPGGTVVKNLLPSAGDTRDTGLIPGSGRYLGGGNGNPLQYSCLEKSLDRGAWGATDHGATKSQTQLRDWAHHSMWLSLKFVIGPFVFWHTFMLFLVSTSCLGITTPENGFPNNELWNHSSANFFLAYCPRHSLLNSTIMFFGGRNTRPLKLILILFCK